MRPRRPVHFKVRDLKAATEAAVQRGGSLVPDDGPWSSADGQVTVRDPDGALFTLDQSLTAPWPVTL
ncbi:hypothetical protein DEJ50_08275 [Streptomyces venezuelae]|uniref:Glyoxalase-like domain-containing protein n=1 Tax=Streptomyces venezuelae TaxID=54571 RepID=A0A5P2CY56_STRVZ|nr:VOC family protein [Streptomyces venezuelae]QES47805.1 hypothetical protein DEJ50_08275 [Streptomyces venezuelae]